jgi:tetratricopeptide (TPR) repeat protein
MTTASTGGAEPKTADAFSRRGAARASRNDLPGAIADFTQAIALDPKNPAYLRQRAFAYDKTDAQKALDDLGHALVLDPNDEEALIARSEIRLGLRADDDESVPAGLTADLDTAARVAAQAADARLELAHLYEAAGNREAAIGQYDLWIAAHPVDNRIPSALNGRCWARAILGHDLDQAEADCSRALRLQPGNPDINDSRALVYFKKGDLAHALHDYNAALKADAKLASSLYGRGLIEIRQGKAAQGAVDIAAAKASDAKIVNEAKRWGLNP